MSASATKQRHAEALSATVLCPECGTPMSPVFRCVDPDGLHAWFECPRPHCAGQFLKVEPLRTKAPLLCEAGS
jgi:hypothetical protein